MSSKNQIPTFNMKVVVHETGLKPDTLRAWERRYGVPNPERTPGGHRLYSQYEIDMLKWLVDRQSEGMSISHAVELWQQLERDGKNPLLAPDSPAVDSAFAHVTGERVDDLRKAWIEACLAFDEYQAQHLLARAFALFPLETVCFEILQQGLRKIGDGWYAGDVSVQQEHFASALALRQLEALLAALPAPTKNGRIIVACPPTEQHTFSSLIISLMLRRLGWDTVYLGANVPLDRLEASVKQIAPLLVILSAQTLNAAANILPLAQKLQELEVPLAFGGAVFNQIPKAKEAIHGHFLGSSLDQVPQVVERLIQTTPSPEKVKKPTKAYRAAHRHFVEKRSAIEARLHGASGLSELPTAFLKNINSEFGNNLESALQLGDLAMVNANLEWVKGLLLNNHQRISELSLKHYLRLYQTAVAAEMDNRAEPILDWFAQLD